MPRILEVKDLIKRYNKAKINSVNSVSFYVEEGSFFSLLGPNGAGKTTTISILTTLLAPTSGKVTIAGYDVQTQPNKVREQIGVIFQNPSLDQNLTAEENIRFHANLYNLFPYRPLFSLMPKEYQDRVHALAEILDLTPAIHKPVKSLSGGMKRKLEIIRSLMHKPKILFLDEPTTGLDPISRKSLWKYLVEIRKAENVTIFLTTHYLEEAENSDYICIIDEGRIVSKGTPTEIKEALIEKYIVVDADNRKKLAAALKKLPVKVKGTGPFNVYYREQTSQQLISSIPLTLSYLDIHNPSLEDAYVEIIQKNHART